MLGPVTPDSTDHPTNDRGNEVRSQVFKGKTQMPNKLIKMLSPFSPQGSVNETALRFYITPIRLAIIKETNDKCT